MPREFISRYTHDLTSDDLGKLFTRETPEAYRFFARGINTAELEGLPWYQKVLRYAQGFFLAFTMRLSPARTTTMPFDSFGALKTSLLTLAFHSILPARSKAMT